MKNKLFFACFIFLLVIPVLAMTRGQDEEDIPAPVLTITGINAVDLPNATITVNVVDAFGQQVPGLTLEDFTLSGELAEQARIVRVENVTDDDLPISVVLMIDTSSSMAGTPIERARQAAALFVENLGENDSVAILTFDSTVRLVQDFTTDKDTLRRTIATFAFGGQTALYDGSLRAIEQALTAPNQRRTIILLGDGSEFGGVDANNAVLPASTTSRVEALRTAQVRGVPVYTIGLGFGADRTYLEDLANATNGRFYESPSPENLTTIYTEIAGLLRTQYIITLDAPLALDGTEYSLSLSAQTPRGATNTDDAVLRAPIPVPIIRLPEAPSAPLRDITTFTFNILADDRPLDIRIDDNIPAEAGDLATDISEEVVIIGVSPRDLPPGVIDTTLSITDSTGDFVTESFSFEIASLPSEFSVDGLPEDGSLSGILPLTTEITLRTNATYTQTPIERVVYAVDGETIAEVSEAPYSTAFNVFDVFGTGGDFEFSTTVITASGEATTQTQTLNINISPPPTVTPVPTITPTATLTPVPTATDFPTPTEIIPTLDIAATVSAQSPAIQSALDGFGALSATRAAATQTVQAELDTQATLDIQATIDTQAAFDAQATLDTQAQLDAQATLDTQTQLDAQATLDTEATADAQNELDAQATLDAELAQQSEATQNAINTVDAQLLMDTAATLDAQSTATANAMFDAARATQTAVAERNIQGTLSAEATLNTQATADAQATIESEGTFVAQAAVDDLATADAATETFNAESTQIGQTLEAQATFDAESTQIGQTLEAQATSDAEATLTAEAVTDTPVPTVTPVAIVEVEDSQPGASFTEQVQDYLPFICGGGLLILLVLFFFLRGRERQQPPSKP